MDGSPNPKTSYTDPELDEMAHGNPPLPARPWRITGPISYIGPPRNDEDRQLWSGDPEKVSVQGVVESAWKFDPKHPILAWHFPGRPVLPGVFGLDQLLQLTGFYCGHFGMTGEGSATGCKGFKFRAPLQPGVELVRYRLQVVKFRKSDKLSMAVAHGRVYADDTLATEAFDISAAIAAPK